MRSHLFTGCFLLLVLAAPGPAFIRPVAGTVTGYVNPPEAAMRAWIFSNTDTLTASVENSGHFQVGQVKPGNYRLLVEAKPPYRNSVREGIRVADGAPTDVGTIEMQR